MLTRVLNEGYSESTRGTRSLSPTLTLSTLVRSLEIQQEYEDIHKMKCAYVCGCKRKGRGA